MQYHVLSSWAFVYFWPEMRNYLHYTWYYITTALVILALVPALLWSVRPGAPYRAFFKTARVWGHVWLRLMGIFPRPERYELKHKGPFVLVGNHASDMDIPLTFVASPAPVVFMGKAELTRLPLFGYFFKKTSIPVDRGSIASGRQALAAADARLRAGQSVCIFPEGKVPDPEWILSPFKAGAFKLAVDNRVPVVVMSIYDNKFRLGHYGGESSFGPSRVRILAEEWPNMDAENPVKELSDRVYKILVADLKSHGHTGKEALPLTPQFS